MTATEPTDDRVVRLDNRQIRILAHPLRARLLGALRVDGPATATSLARTLNTNTGATSYHLRQLAEVGLVVEEPDRAAGRQRFWRAAHDLSSWRATDFDDDPDASAAADWMRRYQLNLMAGYGERWLAAAPNQPRAWREAAGFSDLQVTLRPDQLRALRDELWAVVNRYSNQPPPDGPETRQVVVFVSAVPRIEEAR